MSARGHAGTVVILNRPIHLSAFADIDARQGTDFMRDEVRFSVIRQVASTVLRRERTGDMAMGARNRGKCDQG